MHHKHLIESSHLESLVSTCSGSIQEWKCLQAYLAWLSLLSVEKVRGISSRKTAQGGFAWLNETSSMLFPAPMWSAVAITNRPQSHSPCCCWMSFQLASDLLSEFQMSDHIICIDSKFWADWLRIQKHAHSSNYLSIQTWPFASVKNAEIILSASHWMPDYLFMIGRKNVRQICSLTWNLCNKWLVEMTILVGQGRDLTECQFSL